MTDDESTNARTIADEQRPEGSDAEQPDGRTDHPAPDAGPTDEEAGLVAYRLRGEEILVPEGTDARALKREHDVEEEAVLTFRDEDAGEIVALNDEDVVTEEADPGTEFRAQPLSGSEVFGGR